MTVHRFRIAPAVQLRACAFVLLLGTGASQAGPFPAQVLEEAQLAALRGGFSLRGLEMEFGASLRSFQDGRLLMETLVNVTEQGTRTATHIPSALGTVTSGADSAAGGRRASGIDLGSLAGAGQVVVNDPRGTTAAVHQVTRQRILSVLVSRANDTALRQEAQVDVTVRNFSQFQQSVRQALVNSHLGRLTAPSP